MKKQEIEEAIKRLNNGMTKINDLYENNVQIKDDLCLAIDCMQNELERLVDKPPSLED